MTDLADFLLARIAEDEAVARAATPGPWQDLGGYVGDWGDGPDRPNVQVTDWGTADVDQRGNEDPDLPQSRRDSVHIARWDPARARAECEAKRRIVEFHKSWPVLVEQPPEFAAPTTGLNDMTFRMTQQIAWATQDEYRKRFGSEPPTAPMLRALALPYADHPDYREEWRP